MKTYVIAAANHKGGVGKTTSVLNIGARLARARKKMLLVDVDPQSNLIVSLRYRYEIMYASSDK
jgi:chromosome partitioning protein